MHVKDWPSLSGVPDWTLHDIRRTVSTGLVRLGVLPHVTERILNHGTDTLGGVAGVYNRFGYLQEMRVALESWSAHIDDLRETAKQISLPEGAI